MLVLAYIVLMLGFYFAPTPEASDNAGDGIVVGHDAVGGLAMSASVALSRLWV